MPWTRYRGSHPRPESLGSALRSRLGTAGSFAIKNVGMSAWSAWCTQSIVRSHRLIDRCSAMQRSAPSLISSRFLFPIVGRPVWGQFGSRTSTAIPRFLHAVSNDSSTPFWPPWTIVKFAPYRLTRRRKMAVASSSHLQARSPVTTIRMFRS